MSANSFFITRGKAVANEKSAVDDPPPAIVTPSCFGIAILAGKITHGVVDFVWIFNNKTDEIVTVEWLPNSQPFDVVITDGKGGSWLLNDYMDPPPPQSNPVAIQPLSESVRVLNFDPSAIPGLNLMFDEADKPYHVHLKLNSSTHEFEASTSLAFALF